MQLGYALHQKNDKIKKKTQIYILPKASAKLSDNTFAMSLNICYVVLPAVDMPFPGSRCLL